MKEKLHEKIKSITDKYIGEFNEKTIMEAHVSYFKHLFLNWKVALKCFVLFIFHFIHGIIPCKLTEHERYKR